MFSEEPGPNEPKVGKKRQATDGMTGTTTIMKLRNEANHESEREPGRKGERERFPWIPRFLPNEAIHPSTPALSPDGRGNHSDVIEKLRNEPTTSWITDFRI